MYANGMEPWPENEVMEVFEDGCWIDCAFAMPAVDAAMLATMAASVCLFEPVLRLELAGIVLDRRMMEEELLA